ncbi:outer membrane protein [Sporomusaceae bacterium BoRhaA]|uniref:OmpH family outer membrane protein n=1 Tax=Pelorhabdus rhamnosifermentans TaxID=2772457 RepID=UPI001C062B6B|nr:OmpH family outer membrane protein [Pelorhabdus rhamnosifermentans]MBU2698973.1 outer membrane protein [Pelorhabdus rhamnosifermentans]
MGIKFSGVIVSLLLGTTLLLGGCGTQPAIGILDVNKVMSDSPQVKALQDQLNAKGKELSDQLEKDKTTISEDEFKKRQEAAYGDFLKTKQDLEGQIDSNIKQTLEQVSKDKKLSIVIYKNSIAQGGVDITDDVIAKMPAAPATPAPAK